MGHSVFLPPEKDTSALITSAERLDKAWPWQAAIPEVDRVARHGKQAGPFF